ncbi:MAG TPA: serine hydrolase domain-containing protein [Xanthomonadaceae bacterium]|nr:serine hydrolase domain-containing protein [Xanthomonadaceae bacterium]
MLLVGACTRLPPFPADGDPVAALDRRVATEVARAGLPGATFAVLRGGEIVHLRAHGVADADHDAALSPHARMRIASVSKPITAIALLRLAEQGRLDLDVPVLEPLAARLPEGFQPHAGFAGLSTRHLLAHCGGFDHGQGPDPMLNARRMGQRLGVPSPPPVEAIVVWALSRPPDFPPGSRCVYSNLGYAVLGRVIEAVTGQDYGQAVHALVLRPAGVPDMRLAASLPAERAPDEPRYHDARMVPSVFDASRRVPLPDGGFAIESMDAHGGWLATAAELVRLAEALEGKADRPLLTAARYREMLTPPFPRVPGGRHYALGWDVAHGGYRYWHSGDLPGSTALLVRERDGTLWALLANGSVADARVHERLRRRIGVALRRFQPRNRKESVAPANAGTQRLQSVSMDRRALDAGVRRHDDANVGAIRMLTTFHGSDFPGVSRQAWRKTRAASRPVPLIG